MSVSRGILITAVVAGIVVAAAIAVSRFWPGPTTPGIQPPANGIAKTRAIRHAIPTTHAPTRAASLDDLQRTATAYGLGGEPAERPSPPPQLQWDPKISFAENLAAFRRFCRTADRNALPYLTAPFLEALQSVAKDHAAELESLLRGKEDAPYVKVAILSALVQAGADVGALTWGMALNNSEDMSVRRVAASFLQRMPKTGQDPSALSGLFAAGDEDLSIGAAGLVPTYLNDVSFQQLMTAYRSSGDNVNVQAATVRALKSIASQTSTAGKTAAGKTSSSGGGTAASSDIVQSAASTLQDIVAQRKTSAETAFAPSSIDVRTAISGFDAWDDASYAKVKAIASDENEDPGVRRVALAKCAERTNEDAAAFLAGLGQILDDSNVVVMRGWAEATIKCGGASGVALVRERTRQIENLSVRSCLLKTLENASATQTGL